MRTCARCGGRFPRPGITKDGKVYCCDKCAAGPMAMMPRMALRMLPVAALLVGIGAILGRYATRHPIRKLP